MLTITRRHFPHWTSEGATYFVTFVTYHRRKLTGVERTIVMKHILAGCGRFYDCNGAVVMNDHVHLVVTPYRTFTLSKIMKGIKGVSAHEINRRKGRNGKVWRFESFDHVARDERDLKRILSYLITNPAKMGCVVEPEDYQWLYVPGVFDPGAPLGLTGSPTAPSDSQE